MTGVEEELWNIFTFYTLRGNPLDLTRLSVTQFLRLARDCQIVDEGGTASHGSRQGQCPSSEALRQNQRHCERRIGQAAVNLAFASVIQGRAKVRLEDGRDRKAKSNAGPSSPVTTTEYVAQKSKLTYPEFLDALMVLGERMYRQQVARGSRSKPNGGRGQRSVESTFQQLLMEHILPLASRRRPTSITAALSDSLVRDLLRHYQPAMRELFRFYAVTPSATARKSSLNSSSYSDEVESRKDAQPAARDGTRGETGLQAGTSDVEAPFPLPQSPIAPNTITVDTPIAAATTTSATTTNTNTNTNTNNTPGALTEEVASTGVPVPCSVSTPATTLVDNSVAGENTAGTTTVAAHSPFTASTLVLPPTSSSRCTSSISWSVSQDGVPGNPRRKPGGDVSDGDIRRGDGGGGGGGGSGGGGGRGSGDQRERKSRPLSARSSRSSVAARVSAMNSMADTLSHQCLLWFTADFGISGALLSTLEVGEVFLSCRGGLVDAVDGAKQVETRAPDPGNTDRTSLARDGKSRVRPLTFPEFLEALVRMSLICFRRTGGKDWDRDNHEEGCEEPVDPGHCLRALLTHMFWKRHDSSEMALNGVRAGGARHRSSIRKGALLKGVQLFNEQMLSRWRYEGFLDFASSSAASSTSSGSTLRCYPRQGQATEVLRAMLALDSSKGHAADIDDHAEVGEKEKSGLHPNHGEERGGGGEGADRGRVKPGEGRPVAIF